MRASSAFKEWSGYIVHRVPHDFLQSVLGVLGWLRSEPAIGQRCRLCCQVLWPLPIFKNAAKIREFKIHHRSRSSITHPESVADLLPAHFTARALLFEPAGPRAPRQMHPLAQMLRSSSSHRRRRRSCARSSRRSARSSRHAARRDNAECPMLVGKCCNYRSYSH